MSIQNFRRFFLEGRKLHCCDREVEHKAVIKNEHDIIKIVEFTGCTEELSKQKYCAVSSRLQFLPQKMQTNVQKV